MPETMPARTEFDLPRRALHVGDRVTTDETTSPRFGKVGTILSFEREPHTGQ